MKALKILLICTLHFGSKVQAWVAPNLEPFLLSSQGMYIENDGFLKEYRDSEKALYAFEDLDPVESRFYPKEYQNMTLGKMNYFLCGGGYPHTAIQVYGKGYIYCGPFNGTPSDEQLFQTFDSENGSIVIWPITRPGILRMWHNYPYAGDSNLCHDAGCRFNLIYPGKELPKYEVVKLIAGPKIINPAVCWDDVPNDGIWGTANLDYEPHNTTKTFSATRKITHTTKWSHKFAQNFKFEKTLDISNIWSGLSDSIIIGFDATKGISYSKSMNITSSNTITFEVGHFLPFQFCIVLTFHLIFFQVDPFTQDSVRYATKICHYVKILFTAKVRQTEFDALTNLPIHSNLTIHGHWEGSLLGFPRILCESNPCEQEGNHIECKLQYPIEPILQSKKCHIFEGINEVDFDYNPN